MVLEELRTIESIGDHTKKKASIVDLCLFEKLCSYSYLR
jgi:hypothetical protein